MRQKYKDKDVMDRLHNTVIRYKGVPFICLVEGSTIIQLNDIANGNLAHKVHSEDPDLDISSINIGYVNIDDPDYKTAVYLKREPLRRFKQGLEFNNLTQKVLRNDVSSVHPTKIGCRGFVNAVMGVFPSYKDAMDMITRKSYFSVALSRDIAIKREKDLLKVYLKDDEVGYMRMGSNEVIVPKTDMAYYHVYLLESIKEWKVTEGI